MTLTPHDFNTDEYGTTFFAEANVGGGTLDALYFGTKSTVDVRYRFDAPVAFAANSELRFDIGSLNGAVLQAYAEDADGGTHLSAVGAGGKTSGWLSGLAADRVTFVGFTLDAPSQLNTYSPSLNGVEAVPEPTSLAAIGAGLVILTRRRKR